MIAIIKWNAERNGVEIQTNDEHFVIDAQPSRVMSWHDAVRFYQNAGDWKLPTKKQLIIVAQHLKKVNTLLEQHGGYNLFGWHWSSDEFIEFCAWSVDVNDGDTYYYDKYDDCYVRAVSAFQNQGIGL